jgi:N-acetylglucosaminyldiphosphoundecaprenol N-acetyl-beta-D-mannosaminyltransferase
MVMEAYDDSRLRGIINRAGLVTTDGMPLVWYLRKRGYPQQSRVYGPLLMPALLAQAERDGWKVGLYGGDERTIESLRNILPERYPKLKLAYSYSPPFRALSEDEVNAVREEITRSEVQLLFVGLGCPKQEFFMDAHAKHLPLVMVGVGAAFPFLAGTVRQAPSVVQNSGLEWLFRLVAEPKRLWKRYSRVVPRFMFLMLFPRLQRPSA